MPSKVWDETTYPFPNFNGCTVEVYYTSMLGLRLIHVSKSDPGVHELVLPAAYTKTCFHMPLFFSVQLTNIVSLHSVPV